MFGLEAVSSNELARIHGYSVVELGEYGGLQNLRQWPRRSFKANNGTVKIVPDHQFDLNDAEYIEHVYALSPSSTSTSRESSTTIEARIDASLRPAAIARCR